MSNVSTEKDMLQCYLSSCVTGDPDSAYVARFPWQLNPPSLTSKFTVTERKAQHMLKHLAKTPTLLQITYSKIIDEQEAGGSIERVKPFDNQLNFHNPFSATRSPFMLMLFYRTILSSATQLFLMT